MTMSKIILLCWWQ